ncbi:hypothetical protein GCM10028791_25710 [Echinicola sediminis]
MKILIYILLFAFVTLLGGPFLSYWLMMLVWAILGALIGGDSTTKFFSAALGVGAVWFGQTLWISFTTGSPLPEMMGEIMQVGGRAVLMAITGLLGFLLGGFSALTGDRFRKLFEKKKTYYFK